MGGVCKIQPEIDGWVDCYDLDPEGEFHSAGISFSIHAVLGLWVREIGYKGHSQGPFQSEGRGGRRREGSCTASRMFSAPWPVQKVGDRVSGARDPFSLSPQSWSLSRRLFLSLSSLGGGAQWPWRPVAHRKNTRVLYVAARPHQPG